MGSNHLSNTKKGCYGLIYFWFSWINKMKEKEDVIDVL
jgi:hypothetical protein